MEGRDLRNRDDEIAAQREKLNSVDDLLKEVLQKKLRLQKSLKNQEVSLLNRYTDLINAKSLIQQKIKKMDPAIEIVQDRMQEKVDFMNWLLENMNKGSLELAEKEKTYWKEYYDTIAQLEEELEKERMEYQIDRDMKLLMEKVRERFKNDKQRSMKVAIYAKRRQAAITRQKNLEKTREKLEEEEKSTLEEIEKLKEKQKMLKEKYDSLLEVYDRMEKAKVAMQASATE